MVPSQLSKLKEHNKKMENYVHKLNKRGKHDTAYKIQKKRDILNSHIRELETAY